MLLPLALQLAGPADLARPVAVFTEWSLVERAPRAEHVTARADYRRRDGRVALLPRVVRRGPRPEARAAGTGLPLRVFARAEGWCVELPPVDRPALRVVAEVTRPIERPRAFRTAWPRFAAEGVPSRQLVVVPRGLLEGVPAGWTCPPEPVGEVPCVTRSPRPPALVRRLPALPSPPWSRGLAAALTVLALSAACAPSEGRLERFAGAAGGATVGFALALALVGASVLAWGPALALAVPALTGLGAVAAASGWGRAAGSAALAAVPLMAVAGSRVELVVGLVAALAVAALAGAGSARAQRSWVRSSSSARSVSGSGTAPLRAAAVSTKAGSTTR